MFELRSGASGAGVDAGADAGADANSGGYSGGMQSVLAAFVMSASSFGSDRPYGEVACSRLALRKLVQTHKAVHSLAEENEN